MKRLFILITVLSVWAFGYNYSGKWINKSATSYNDPVKLVIKGNSVTPFIKRGSSKVSLKAKSATNVGSGLYEAWGHGNKNLVLFIKPINSYKLRVVAKKIDVNKKKIITKSFIFTKKDAVTPTFRKRFVGNYKGGDSFSAVNKLSIREVDGKLYVRAWKRGRNGLRALGVAKTKIYNNRLHLTWNRDNLVVNATIKGYSYNKRLNRYNNLELYVKATNLRAGFTNSQTMHLRRGEVAVPARPIYKEHKIRPAYSY